ncbi:MAG: hypothetical protein AUJ49_03730 [Desulfovibrionaceae bacterium CG1_02_65_16]|nr:MAG: hypothetical protein AUJ49_03730 [Desulfovibrionaceae bacterium CG1_02_65_16]
MNSLRETMENAFAAAAFAERNLHQEAREFLGEGAQPRAQSGSTRAAESKNKRQRPSLKA